MSVTKYHKLSRYVALPILLLALSGCQTISGWFGANDTAEKPAALVEFSPTATLHSLWQAAAGSAGNFVLQPALVGDGIYTAARDGQLQRLDASNGRQVWRIDSGHKLSAGVGAGEGLILVGTEKGEVLAFDNEGRPRWQAQVSSEILSPPQAASGVVVVRSGDGRIVGLDVADGKRKWVYQRSVPALSLRSAAGVVVAQGAIFAGFAGGKLVALNLANGNVGWEASVAQPRGSTELERVADVTSLPVIDARQICAVAYQGRVACFDIQNGNPIWARDISSSAGLAIDSRNVYISDQRGAVVALDKTSGASVWKQDKLSARRLSAPLVRNGHIVVADMQGYVHLLTADSGAFAARMATDASAIRAQPTALDNGFLVQTSNGGLFALAVN